MAESDGAPSDQPHGKASSNYRGDIDGLRAVAVLLVVCFHAGIAPFTGGYVGVDSFFVISGFLITGLLLNEVQRSQRIDLIQFWLRRARRLFPALAVVVIATMVLALAFFVSPVTLPEVARQAVTATLYVSNLRFATTLQDYFRADFVKSSPFLHTWSLGIEEQFYLLWPLLILATVGVARLVRVAARRAVLVVMVLVSAVSFVVCLQLSKQGSPWAFFGLHARAWEFGLAGILAIHPAPLAGQSARLRAGLGWTGLALVIGSAMLYGSDTTYPGVGVLAPVVGTLLIIGAGRKDDRRGPARILDSTGLRALGRLSFAWYLWHWPLLVFLRARVEDPPIAARLAVVALSLALAWVTHRLVENPIRFSPVLAASRWKTAAVAAAFCVAALAVTGGVAVRSKAEAKTPLVSEVIAATRDFGITCVPQPTGCSLGDIASQRRVVVVGDSHAEQWLPALDAAGKRLGLRIVRRTFRGCPPYDVTLQFASRTASESACTRFNRETRAQLTANPPVAVIASAASGQFDFLRAEIRSTDGSTSGWEAWSSAIEKFGVDLRALGTDLGLIFDTPVLSFNPAECVALHRSFRACEPSRAEATSGQDERRAAELSATKTLGAPVLDPTDLVCLARTCPLRRNNVVVFKDFGHLSASFSLTLSGPAEAFLRQLT